MIFLLSVTSLYKDIVAIDKRKIQEEIDNLPKPEHLVEAEKLLLSFEGMRKWVKFLTLYVVSYEVVIHGIIIF